ncbi:recombinase family protein [Allorhizocola rhizosphaerae]|uniref:recombinase family protein n=1 Tax=Allorhizocola rhizosphaerae TaxID=1872709 RepID=UPI001FE7E81B|nr:recombinase family protein [Allorhizocola rhizosphaerae]
MLTDWASQRWLPVARSGSHDTVPAGIRFAFYGRMSTEEWQDPATSRRWQYDSANALVAGHGAIVTEFFDIGYTRRRGWHHRPQAAALLKLLADRCRGFDAVVVGESDRVFYGKQLILLAPVFAEHGVGLWLPDMHGPLDIGDAAHQAVLLEIGKHSRREVLRARYRTTAAMQAQAREEGRYLGGRPPYGYRLADAGPHPNRAFAKWGRRRHRFEPDPDTAPWVRWMFARRLEGCSYAGIARALNEAGVPCPSEADPQRNRHRHNHAWALRSVASILGNPRYTGRQVWNRQNKQHPAEDDIKAQLAGRQPPRHWNLPDGWVISKTQAHPALVSEQDFVAAQCIRAVPQPADGTTRTYLLTGLLRCGGCGRKMEGHWAHGRPGYRCRHGRNSANPAAGQRSRNLYRREDDLIGCLMAAARPSGPLSMLVDKLLPPSTGQQLAEALRRHQVSIVCRLDGLTIEPGGHRIPQMFTTRQRGTRLDLDYATSTVVE